MKTIPVYALSIASFIAAWNLYLVSFSQPEYMNNVIGVDLESVRQNLGYSRDE